MTNDEYQALETWAQECLNFSASDVQNALAYRFGGDYDITTITASDAQQACADFALFADDVYGSGDE
jgi:hypothetical protein